MKTTDQARIDELRCETAHLALAAKLTRADGGLTLGWIGHDRELTIGGLIYKPEQSLSPSALESTADASADNAEIAFLTSDDVTEGDLKAGVWDNATVEFMLVTDTEASPPPTIPLKKALVGNVTVESGRWRMNLVGFGERLAQPVVDLTQITCRNRLGDAICRVPLKPAVWQATTAYTAIASGDRAVGSTVRPSTYTGLDAECIVAGTSAGGEPSWPGAAGGTVVDGTVTWRMYVAWTQRGTVTDAFDRARFEDIGQTVADGFFRYGKLVWLTGANAGRAAQVRYFDQPGGGFTLVDEMPDDIAVGDTFECEAGCAWRIQEDCKTKFDNAKNFGGDPFLPGGDEAANFPNAR